MTKAAAPYRVMRCHRVFRSSIGRQGHRRAGELFEPRFGSRDVQELSERNSPRAAALDDTERGPRLRMVEAWMTDQSANPGKTDRFPPDGPIQGVGTVGFTTSAKE